MKLNSLVGKFMHIANAREHGFTQSLGVTREVIYMGLCLMCVHHNHDGAVASLQL